MNEADYRKPLSRQSEAREDFYDIKGACGSDTYNFTKDQYEKLVSLLQTSDASAVQQGASSRKVNLKSHVTHHGNFTS
ncbi:hypothetical protein A2U01_0030925, partial [Trifolium medium]|nr:hypothetical protein [Trifolium medium]